MEEADPAVGVLPSKPFPKSLFKVTLVARDPFRKQKKPPQRLTPVRPPEIPSPQTLLESASRWFLNFDQLATQDALVALREKWENASPEEQRELENSEFMKGAAEMMQLGIKVMWLKLCERTRKMKIQRTAYVPRRKGKRVVKKDK